MVRFENVGMRYGSGPEVLRDVSFSLEPGSFTFLTGLSGAGKTTLLKLIYVAEPPSRGLITLFGTELATALKRGDLHAWAAGAGALTTGIGVPVTFKADVRSVALISKWLTLSPLPLASAPCW